MFWNKPILSSIFEYNFFCILFFRSILLPVRYIMMERKTAYKRKILSYLISKIIALFQIKLEEFMKIPVTFKRLTWIPKVIEIFTFFVFFVSKYKEKSAWTIFSPFKQILKHYVREEWTSGGVNYSGFEEWYILENLHLADF